MHKFYNKLVICISNLAWKFKFHLGIPWILFFWWVVVFLMSTNLVLESFMTTRQGQNLLLYYTCNEKVSLRETIYYHFTISVHLKSSLIKGGGGFWWERSSLIRRKRTLIELDVTKYTLPITGAWHVWPQPLEQHFMSPPQSLSEEHPSTHILASALMGGHSPGLYNDVPKYTLHMNLPKYTLHMNLPKYTLHMNLPKYTLHMNLPKYTLHMNI